MYLYYVQLGLDINEMIITKEGVTVTITCCNLTTEVLHNPLLDYLLSKDTICYDLQTCDMTIMSRYHQASIIALHENSNNIPPSYNTELPDITTLGNNLNMLTPAIYIV